VQVVAGELELNHECNLLNWSPEDFESKLQVRLFCFYIFSCCFEYFLAGMGIFVFSMLEIGALCSN